LTSGPVFSPSNKNGPLFSVSQNEKMLPRFKTAHKKWTGPFFEGRKSYARKIIINGGISIGTFGALCRPLAVLSTEYCIKESCFLWDNCHLLSIRQSDELMKGWQSS
jgi:hypothetical protein